MKHVINLRSTKHQNHKQNGIRFLNRTANLRRNKKQNPVCSSIKHTLTWKFGNLQRLLWTIFFHSF